MRLHFEKSYALVKKMVRKRNILFWQIGNIQGRIQSEKVLEGRGETVKYLPNGVGTLRRENTASSLVEFTQSFIQGAWRTPGIRAEGDPWQPHRCSHKVQPLVHRFYRVRGHAEGHCSRIKGFTCTSKGLHALTWQLTLYLDLVASPVHQERKTMLSLRDSWEAKIKSSPSWPWWASLRYIY